MPTHRVLGAGGVGPAIAYWLAHHSKGVDLVDMDGARLDAARKGPLRGLKIGTVSADIVSEKFRFDMFRGPEVITSAVPARFNPSLAAGAIVAERHFLDLGGVLSVTQDMRDGLHGRAKAAGVSIIPDCGLMPGLGNMMAAHIAHRLGGADDITVYVGGLPQKPLVEAGNYQRTFSLEGLLHILEPAPVLKDGSLTEVEPFDGLEMLDVPALKRFNTGFGGAVEAFTTNGAGTASWLMKRLGVKNFREKTVRWPGFVKFIRSIPHDDIRATLELVLPATDREHPDLVWMRVVGRKGDRTMSWELLDTYDPYTGLSAMARTTGFSAATVAHTAGHGLTAHGVLPPEEALNVDDIFACLCMLNDTLDLRFTDSATAS